MHANTFLVALLASAVRAVPNPKVFTSQFWTPDVVHSHGTVIRDEPEVKEQAGVYICEHHTWGGVCEHKLSPLGSAPEDCTVIDGTASSIGPDKGIFCVFYTNALCSAVLSDGSQSLTIHYPGSPNLVQTEKGNFNDKLLSYQCFKEVVEPAPAPVPTTTVIPVPTDAPVVVLPPTEQPPVTTEIVTEELPSPTDVPTGELVNEAPFGN